MSAPANDPHDRAACALILDAVTDVRAELARADAKAASLLTLFGIALTGVVAIAGRGGLPEPITAALWATAGTMTAAVVQLLLVIRPRLRGRGSFTRGCFVGFAVQPPAQLLRQFEQDAAEPMLWQAKRLHALATVAAGKHHGLRSAVHLLLAALAALGTAVALATL